MQKKLFLKKSKALLESKSAIDNSEYQKLYESLPPDDIDCLQSMARLCLKVGEKTPAIHLLENSLSLNPDDSQAHFLLAEIYFSTGKYANAEKSAAKAIGIQCELKKAYPLLGACQLLIKNYKSAKENLEKAHQFYPENTDILCNLAKCCYEIKEFEEAIKWANEGLKKKKKEDPYLYAAMAFPLFETGRKHESIEYFEKCLEADPTFSMAYYNISRSKKFSEKDIEFIEKTEKALAQAKNKQERVLLNFALGKMHDDLKNYKNAFSYYKAANNLRINDGKPPLPTNWKLAEKIKKTFTKKFYKKNSPIHKKSSITPIFILGMPRSGSTLVEQIISSHRKVAAGGELTYFFDAVDNWLNPNKKNELTGEEFLSQVNQKTLEGMREEYLQKLTKHSNNKYEIYITDKLPSNYLYIGLIYLLFPEAKVIHTTRNQYDIYISCYFQNFEYIPWSNNLKSIDKEFTIYKSMMLHWNKLFKNLKKDYILNLEYENLITNPESNCHKIIDWLNLEWEDACLAFHTNKRHANTASDWQVQQPLYKSSKERWKNYEQELSAELSGTQKKPIFFRAIKLLFRKP